MITAPADFRRRTTSASSSGKRSSKTALPPVVRASTVSMLSFRAIGIPWRGLLNFPALASASSAFACASAGSDIMVMYALIFGLYAFARAMHASVNSTQLISRDRIFFEASDIVSLASSSSEDGAAYAEATAAPAVIVINSRRVISIPGLFLQMGVGKYPRRKIQV